MNAGMIASIRPSTSVQEAIGKKHRSGGRMKPSAVLAAIGIALVAGFSVPVSAEDAQSYPSKPVRIFIPYGAGGVGDLTVRLLAQKLSESAGQQFVIENRPGAGGS